MNQALLRLHFLDLEISSHSFDLGPAIADLYESNDLRALFPERASVLNLEIERDDSPWALTIPPLQDAIPAEISIAYGGCAYADGRFVASHEGEPRQILEYVPALRRVRVNLGGRAFEDAQGVAIRFLRPLLRSVVTRQHGLQVFHGAVVSRQGRTLLFMGEAGAGKTTAALAFAHAGWSVLADDGPFLTARDGQCFALSSLDFLQLTEPTLSLFPELRAQCVGAPDIRGKRVVRGRAFRARPEARQALRVTDLIDLRRSPSIAEPRIVPLPRAEVLRDLIHHNMTVFRRRALRDTPELRPGSQFLMDVLTGLVSDSRIVALEYSDAHLPDLPGLIDAMS